jgi:DNA-binding NarL/FixJ family response regulator
MGNFLVQSPARILIADDSSSVRSTLKRVLESHSNLWKVCAEASNGAEAVQMAVESKPDLAIIDLQMPVLDGLSASARIAKSLPMIPILINTIYKSDYVDFEARNAGVREVISKAEPGRLLKAVEALLGKKSRPLRKLL